MYSRYMRPVLPKRYITLPERFHLPSLSTNTLLEEATGALPYKNPSMLQDKKYVLAYNRAPYPIT
jgi:hypothetical protein